MHLKNYSFLSKPPASRIEFTVLYTEKKLENKISDFAFIDFKNRVKNLTSHSKFKLLGQKLWLVW